MAEGRTAFPVEEDGWYVEPEWATTWLLQREKFPGVIWDPSCGQGNILRAAKAVGYGVSGSDIRRRELVCDCGWFEMDFLVCDGTAQYGAASIVMNPPYGHAKTAEAFIHKALSLPHVQKVAAFVNSKFIFGSKRKESLFRKAPPTKVYPINPRPSCPPGQYLLDGGKATGGVADYCWLVFTPRHLGATEIVW